MGFDGKVARTATGRNDNAMHEDAFEVGEFAGRKDPLQFVDAASG